MNEPTESTCPDCDGEGWYDTDMGGGETRKAFCDCEKGQELRERAENARAAYIDAKVDEYMERRRSR